MRSVYTTLEVVTVCFAFAAAWFWFQSGHLFAPDINLESLASLKSWLDHIAYYNRLATSCAAVAALAEGGKILAIRSGLF
jgi:hypothetical protein